MLTLARKFTSFQTLDSMNLTVNKFKTLIKGLVPKSIYTVIDYLSTHSVKLKGVSFGSYEYIKQQTGLSIPTLKRAIKRLKELGFIEVIHTFINGRQRANIIRIKNKINWKHVRDTLMEGVRLEIVRGSDPINDTVDDMQNDTLQSSLNPCQNGIPTSIYGTGSFFETLLKHNKDINIRDPYPFVGYNWLES